MGIHSKNDSLFLKNDLIAIGWSDFGDLTRVKANREAFKAHYAEVYPEAKKGQIANGAGMLYRFLHEVQIDDYVVFPSKTDRKINIGRIKSDYYFDDKDGEYVQRRNVEWLNHIPRLSFSQGALYLSLIHI